MKRNLIVWMIGLFLIALLPNVNAVLFTDNTTYGGISNPSGRGHPDDSFVGKINPEDANVVASFLNESLIGTYVSGSGSVSRSETEINITTTASAGLAIVYIATRNFTGKNLMGGVQVEFVTSASNGVCGWTNDPDGAALGAAGETEAASMFYCNGGCGVAGGNIGFFTDDWGSGTVVEYSPPKTHPRPGTLSNFTIGLNATNANAGAYTFINNSYDTTVISTGIISEVPALATFRCAVDGGGGGSKLRITQMSICNNTGCPQAAVVAPPDTTFPQFTLINLTSEGGLGQIIFNLDGTDFRTTPPFKKTNDSTPTFRLNTSESSTCGITANQTSSYAECTTTGASLHTCTVAVEQPIGTWNFSVNCSDSSSNMNQTQFLVNITDNVKPNVFFNSSRTFFIEGVNNSGNIVFNATDNYAFGNISLERNGTTVYSNSSYLNGTTIAVSFSLNKGVYNFSALATDQQSNQNRTDFLITIGSQCNDVGIFLDGLNSSRKYEFGSRLNISANSSSECTVCIDLDAPGYGVNYSCGTSSTSFIYNITLLRQSNATVGKNDTLSTGEGINITLDNRTDIISASINLSASGTPSNLNISYGFGGMKRLPGNIEGPNLILRKFVHAGSEKNAVNITYLTRTSQSIFVNVTSPNSNLSFDLSGFNLDDSNEFRYNDSFTATGSLVNIVNQNLTLSYNTTAPLGVFDDFSSNVSGRWQEVTFSGSASESITYYKTGESIGDSNMPTAPESLLRVAVAPSGHMGIKYDDPSADLRNTSLVKVRMGLLGSNSDFYFYVTDGTNRVTTWSGRDVGNVHTNFTILRTGTDTFEMHTNLTPLQTFSTSTLDPTKQHRLEWGYGTGANPVQAIFYVFNVDWGGVWLSRHINNGTYVSFGNYTSKVVNVTQKNVSRATLSWVGHEGDGSILGYLSNTCNATIPTFESVTNGVIHPFTSVGNSICYRFYMNTSSNTSSPVVRSVDVNVIKASATNVTVDLNDDGSNEFEFLNTLNSTTSPQRVNLSPTVGYKTIRISSNPGQVQIDNFVLNSTLNPVILNSTPLEDCNNCQINFSFGGGGTVTTNDFRFDFHGSWNYSAVARANSSLNVIQSEANKIMVKYSKYNLTLPPNISYFDVFATARTQSNVTPYGQKNITPIFNVTSLAYDDPFNLYIKTNATLHSCLNITYSPTSKKIDGFKLNTSYQLSNPNISVSGYAGLWAYFDLRNCTNRFLIPYLYSATVCSNCTLTSLTNFDNFNLLVS